MRGSQTIGLQGEPLRRASDNHPIPPAQCRQTNHIRGRTFVPPRNGSTVDTLSALTDRIADRTRERTAANSDRFCSLGKSETIPVADSARDRSAPVPVAPKRHSSHVDSTKLDRRLCHQKTMRRRQGSREYSKSICVENPRGMPSASLTTITHCFSDKSRSKRLAAYPCVAALHQLKQRVALGGCEFDNQP